jgi:hypothetical protein
MIRIIVQQVDCIDAANVGGPVSVSFKTYEVESPKLEMFLREKVSALVQRRVVGAEVVERDILE